MTRYRPLKKGRVKKVTATTTASRCDGVIQPGLSWALVQLAGHGVEVSLAVGAEITSVVADFYSLRFRLMTRALAPVAHQFARSRSYTASPTNPAKGPPAAMASTNRNPASA
jgi:hypothetical protein